MNQINIRFILACSLLLIIPNIVAVGQSGEAYKLSAPQIKPTSLPETEVYIFDDLNGFKDCSLQGPNQNGVCWGGFDIALIMQGDDKCINQTNTLADDGFLAGILADWSKTAQPAAENGFSLSFDYQLSDLNTQRFYTPIAANEGFIFTRLGDLDSDGDWDVLETDGNGVGVFFDTGFRIPLNGNIRFEILDLILEIFVNDTMIYSGGIIGSNGDIKPIPDRLTNMDFDSGNNSLGLNSEQCIDNLLIKSLKKCLVGDVNLDGVVNLFDVQPFVNEVLRGNSTRCEADVNGDGAVDLLDVDPFVESILGG